jgi:hypothetical protein
MDSYPQPGTHNQQPEMIQPGEAERPPTDSHGAGDGARIGPVTFRRYAKKDGRALILYTREEPSAS